MAELRLENVSKRFAPTVAALHGVSLRVALGECLAVVGPSGCGKTTLLRIIAGLEQASEGHVYLDGKRVDQVPCQRRGIAMFFQRPALLPSYTVRQNLAWAWSLREPWWNVRRFLSKNPVREAELARVARQLGLEPMLNRPARELSGGEQQRVALGRCLLRQAKVCLLDEPLGHLDAPLRTGLRRRICALMRENSATMLFVTHDPSEALAVGDRVAVMQNGRIAQVDEPGQLRKRPANRGVAELVHDQGGMNFLAGQLGIEAGQGWFASPQGRGVFSIANSGIGSIFLRESKKNLSRADIIHIMLGIAAENVACTAERLPQESLIQMTLVVVRQEFSTSGSWVAARDPTGREWTGKANPAQRFLPGQEVTMTFSMQATYGFDQATGQTKWVPTD